MTCCSHDRDFHLRRRTGVMRHSVTDRNVWVSDAFPSVCVRCPASVCWHDPRPLIAAKTQR